MSTFLSYAGAILLLTLFAACIAALPVLGAKACLEVEKEARRRGGFRL